MSEKYVTPSGSKVKKIFAPKVEDDGSITLIESGKEDWYGYIQSFKDSVDIHVILKRAINGDISALNRVQGFYADVRDFPKTTAEMLQTMIDAERNFQQLPVEIKQNFDFDVNKFIAGIDKPDFLDKLGIKKTEPIKEDIVVESEVKAE